MTDKDYPPLTSVCVRNLQDKLYEKRKQSALEIEKMIRDFVSQGNYQAVENVIRILGEDFAASSNCHTRKGGLIGLAAVSISLGKHAHSYCAGLVCPVVRCLSDTDSRVRYYACESLYNIVKITKASSLEYFNDIFDAMSKCAADPDPSVRKGSGQLDRVMKDIVVTSPDFDLNGFIPLLRERVYTQNPYARQFIVSWVSTLDSVPDINMIGVIPDILDGLFQILADPSVEIRQKCEMLLEELLRGIEKSPNEVDYASMVNILIMRCKHDSDNDEGCLAQLTAITWIREFLILFEDGLLPFASGIVAAVLPCFAYTDEVRRGIMDCTVRVNEQLMDLVKKEKEEDLQLAVQAEKMESSGDHRGSHNLNMSRTLEVLCKMTVHDCELTRLAALRWMDILVNTRPRQFFLHSAEIFPLLLMTLSDSSTSVVHWALSLLCRLSSHPCGKEVLTHLSTDLLRVPEDVVSALPADTNPYLLRFFVDLVRLLDTDHRMLENRGHLIITDLCSNLGAEIVYRTMAEIVLRLDDHQSAATLVQSLSKILLTQASLHDFRTKLRVMDTEKACFLFCCLYRAWSHNPVSLLGLCLLTQNYQHASVLIKYFGEIEITVDTLTEIDHLIQLLESPIFAYLRLHLLDARHSGSLQETLYCLLMLLPQTEAFHILRRRLQCIPKLPIQGHPVAQSEKDRNPDLIGKHVDFTELLDHFKTVQAQRRAARADRLRDNRMDGLIDPRRLAHLRS